MGDRTYTWFAIPVAALATPEARAAIRRIFEIAPEILTQELGSVPLQDEALGQDDLAVRLVDDVPCLVWEDVECDYGGCAYERELAKAKLPYLHRCLAGDEYGPTRAACISKRHEWVRCDCYGEPIAGIGTVGRRAKVCAAELRALERYVVLRAEVLATH